MKAKRRFPLMAKVAVWLAVHLSVLTVAFAVFVTWQLQFGLNSLLTGETGERLESLGKEISVSLAKVPQSEWENIVAARIARYELEGFIRAQRDLRPDGEDPEIPWEIIQRSKKELPPPRGRPPEPPHDAFPRGEPDHFPPPERARPRDEHESHALFLTRDTENGKYWAAIELEIESPGRDRASHVVLFLRSDNASANGLFFNYKPWLYGGLAVLVLSIALWAPFVVSITRYAGRISRATEKIADGHFETKLGVSRNDELGGIGDSIEMMSTRLGRLISGQKRFLGDVAHELCAPLARMRTGLGILQNSADETQMQRLASIDEDAEELSSLVSELLAFTKASSVSVNLESISLAEFCRKLAARELEGHEIELSIVEKISVNVDRHLLARAVQNVLRNCHRHAGAKCKVRISATFIKDTVNLVIEDNGSGVPDDELGKLFEPFYRPDKSRTRDTGGTGLGMAIVESSVRTFGGKVSAEKSTMGGLLVRMILPKA